MSVKASTVLGVPIAPQTSPTSIFHIENVFVGILSYQYVQLEENEALDMSRAGTSQCQKAFWCARSDETKEK